jgi:5-methyltetrahydrofolate--homocysteine methyltransferase
VPHRRDLVRDYPVPEAPFLGSRVLERIDFRAILPFLNENALFKVQWQFKPQKRRPEEYRAYLEEEARPILRRMLETCSKDDLIAPRAVYGYWRCQSQGNDLIIYDPQGGAEIERFTFPRQQGKKELCISDFFRSVDSGEMDVVAFTAVTVGHKVSEVERRWFAENRYSDYLYLHGLGVESAEALAEYIHRQVRAELGIGIEDPREIEKLFHQHYRGSRYSFGYPACPNLEDQEKLVKLLGAERAGITLSEGYQLEPEQSTTALVVHHPQAKYFNV